MIHYLLSPIGYWIGCSSLIFIINLLPTVKVESKKLIIRLPPDGWVIADESEQGLRSREEKR